MKTKAVIAYSNNSLNTFRLLAALQVLYGHALDHLSISMPPLVNNVIYLFLGVPIFFTLSGYLIWGSVERSTSFRSYIKKRFWRIYPELWVAVLVELVVLLLLYKEPIDWTQFGLFAITQGTIFQFWTPDCLRGYGCGCPNGALWTICIIIQFYLIVYPLYKMLHKRSIVIWIIALAVSVFISFLTPHIRSNMPEIMGKLYGVSLLPYLWMFLIAACIEEFKEKALPFLKKYWAVFIVFAVIIQHTPYDIWSPYPLFFTVMLFLGILGAAYALPMINIKRDISYGIYIYHMTFINALIALGYVGNRWLLLVVVAASCLFAFASNKTIGNWSMRMKSKYAE